MLALLLGLIGAVCIVAGLYFIFPPLALIVGGAALLRLALLIERPSP